MKTKTLTMFDKIAGIAALTFFLYITFLAVDAEGWKDGLLIILRILGTAMAATLAGMIVLSLIVWAAMSWKRNKRIQEIEREVFSQMILENPHKKKGYQPNCEGPNKWAR